MEIIRGKHASFIDAAATAEWLAGYDNIHIDIGTGDGRFVQHLSQTCPKDFAIGIDACRENLQEVSRRAAPNAMYVIANARALPPELQGTATRVTINFPWGSLLEGLVTDNPALLMSLNVITRPNAELEIRLNAGALAQVGWSLEDGANQVRHVLLANGFKVRSARMLTAHELRFYPTTWAKRLAFGRDPRAVYLRAVSKAQNWAASKLETEAYLSRRPVGEVSVRSSILCRRC